MPGQQVFDSTNGLRSLQASNVDHNVAGGEIVEHIALGLRAKGQESCDAHY